MIEFITEQYFAIKALMVIAVGWGFGFGLGGVLALLAVFKEYIRDHFDPPGSD